jgi:putative hemolysin
LTAKEELYIDVKEVIRSKNPGLAQWLPGFVVSYIKRILHQDQINEAMRLNGHLQGLDFVRASLDYLNTKVELVGGEHIPKEGGVILAANHPLGGLDGMAFMKAVGEIRQDFQFLVNDILLNIKNMESLFVPVNKVGVNPRQALRTIEETYAKDIAVLVFPAGLVSRKIPDGIGDLAWQKSFISKAIKYQKDVVPVHIDGRNSNWFYNLSNWRRRIGLKANLEMFYLPDEMFRQQDKTITITVGKPIAWQSFDDSKNLKDWAAEVRSRVYQLAPQKH